MSNTKSVDFPKVYEQLFAKAQNNPDFSHKLSSDPIGALREAGYPEVDDLPAAMQDMLKRLIASLVEVHKNTVNGVYQFEKVEVDDQYVSFNTNIFGLVWQLSEQATQDAIAGSAGLMSALVTLAASSGAVAQGWLTVIALALAAFFAVSAGLIYLTDLAHKKGVYITVPWTDFIPLFGTGTLVTIGPVT